MTQRRAGRSLPDCPTQAASGPDVDQASACASVYPVRGHSDLPPPEPCARPTSTKRCVAEIGRSTDQGGAAARRRVWRSPRRAPALWEAPRGASAPSLLRRGHQITYAQPARWPEAARSPSSSPADCPARGHRARSHGTPHLRGGRGEDGRVSFHLQAFPPSGPRTVLEVRQLLDAEEQRLITGTDDSLPPFGPEMTTQAVHGPFRPAGNQRQVAGPALPSSGRADEVYTAILEIATRANVIIYDPQAGEVTLPPGPT